MRIAILHPYRNVAETESAARIVLAAAALGHEAREFLRSEDIPAFAPDFVLSLTHQDPKLLDIPTYGVLTAPLSYYESAGRFMRNILTYDAVLTVSPEVREWVSDLYFALRKTRFTEFYANTLPIVHSDACVINGDSRAMYVGTNWDGKRHADLFDHLAQSDVLRIYGPERAWTHIPRSAYAGSLPFDGTSAVVAYRSHGIGLCLARSEFNDNGLPTSRIFETTAAGALAICPRNKFIQDMYGDSVLYVDQQSASDTLAKQIETHVAWARANPADAMKMAADAQKIFNERLSLQALIPRVLALHEKVLREKWFKPSRSTGPRPVVSYVMRSGGRDLAMVARALKSLEAQTADADIRVHLILYRPRPEIESYVASYSGRLSIRVVLAYGGNRSATLWAGLRDVKLCGDAEYFAILDDDDELYTNHVALLLDQLRKANQGQQYTATRVTYSGNTERHPQIVHERIKDTFNLPREETLRMGQFAPFSVERLLQFKFYMTSFSFLAATSLLDDEVLEDPDFGLSEDYYLFILMAQRTQFAFCPEVTATYHFHGEGSGYEGANPLRDHYLKRLRLRTYRRRAVATSEVDFFGMDKLPGVDEHIVEKSKGTFAESLRHFGRESTARKIQLVGILFKVILTSGPRGLFRRLKGYLDYQVRMSAGHCSDPEEVRETKRNLWHWNPEPAKATPDGSTTNASNVDAEN